MSLKSFKSFHAAIENDIAASLGGFSISGETARSQTYSNAVLGFLNAAFKRVLDIVFSLLLLAFSAPLFLVIAIAIKANSPGPVFFRQERIGHKGRHFRIWKFRTMRPDDSEKEHKAVVESLLSGDQDAGTPEALEQYLAYLERRITSIGKFLRASSLDELPQLFNVLAGDMSLVGPRPHPTYEVEAYKQWYRRRLNVKPGLTGWSKLNLRFTPDNYEEAILYDLWYVDNWNLWLDFRILFMTVPFVLSMRDAT